MSASESAAKPDVGQLRMQTLPEAPFPGDSDSAFRVFVEPEVHAGVWQHATESVAVEICGVLVGRWAHDAAGPFAHVNAFIRGDAAANKFAEVTFTHETSARINQQMDTKYADRSIVGWYHSHPDFGIFLSDRDRFIQEHFFAGAGQVAYVLDPVRKTEGMFAWQKGQPALAPHYWVGDRVQVSTPAGSEVDREAGRAGDPEKKALSSELPGSRAPGLPFAGWMESISRSSGYLLAFLIGLLLAGYLTHALNDFERMRIEQAAQARTLLYLQFRPGMGEELDKVRGELGTVLKDASGLANQHLKALEDPKEAKVQWEAVLARVAKAGDQLARVRAAFALSPEETDRLLRLMGIKDDSKKDKAEPPAGKK